MKSVLIHALLALAGLAGAYAVYAAKGTENPLDGDVEVFRCAQAIDSVSFTGPAGSVTLAVKQQDGGKNLDYWFSVQGQDGDHQNAKTFVGASKATAEYLALLSPLRARRALGELDRTVLQELNLADQAKGKRAEVSTQTPAADAGQQPKGESDAGAQAQAAPVAALPTPQRETFTLHCRGEAHRFRVGAGAFGSENRYLQDEASRMVYLIHGDVVYKLQAASSRLMQRKLVDLPPSEIASLEVKVGSQARTLLHRNRLDPERAEWVEAKAPDKRNEQFGNFVGRFEQLAALEYLPMGEEPGAAAAKQPGAGAGSALPVPVLAMRFKGAAGEDLGHVDLMRIDGPQRPTYYAKGPATRAWVTVAPSVARQVEDDARAMVGLDPLPRPRVPKDDARGDTRRKD